MWSDSSSYGTASVEETGQKQGSVWIYIFLSAAAPCVLPLYSMIHIQRLRCQLFLLTTGPEMKALYHRSSEIWHIGLVSISFPIFYFYPSFSCTSRLAKFQSVEVLKGCCVVVFMLADSISSLTLAAVDISSQSGKRHRDLIERPNSKEKCEKYEGLGILSLLLHCLLI